MVKLSYSGVCLPKCAPEIRSVHELRRRKHRANKAAVERSVNWSRNKHALVLPNRGADAGEVEAEIQNDKCAQPQQNLFGASSHGVCSGLTCYSGVKVRGDFFHGFDGIRRFLGCLEVFIQGLLAVGKSEDTAAVYFENVARRPRRWRRWESLFPFASFAVFARLHFVKFKSYHYPGSRVTKLKWVEGDFKCAGCAEKPFLLQCRRAH